MSNEPHDPALRLLIIDDNPAIHRDIRRILEPAATTAPLDALEATLFGDAPPAHAAQVEFEIESAHQGQEGLERVLEANAAGRPFAVAFVDMRMPPGWDGLETIERLWQHDHELLVVICTAYSDHTWNEISQRIGNSHRWLILSKPFDNVEVRQLAHSLTHKWQLQREVNRNLATLERLVEKRTESLRAALADVEREVAAKLQLEANLRLAQKLEAVGQLASGIAHELNTPIQYIGDSARFVQQSYAEVFQLVDGIRDAVAAAPGAAELQATFAALEEQADLPYLAENIPRAFDRLIDGVDRTASIVRAMKDFAHPGSDTKEPADLNQAIRSTSIVAKAEYKFIADLELELGDIPHVPCLIGDLNQVFLTMIVNAAHAIVDAQRGDDYRGKITVRTRQVDDDVIVDIEDTGCGIPEEIRDRIMEPFFTTKDVGRGSGQGLAITRNVIVDKHRGAVSFETVVGEGTCFHLRIPLSAPAEAVAG